uniref:MBD domain-containing protein n=1 Tax=Strigamia maritima TaxID=126957 RepID=T1IGX2_STRMM
MANEPSLNNSLNNLHHDNTLAKAATKPENYSVSLNVWHHRYAHMYTKGLNYLANDKNVKGDSPLDISNGSETHSFNPNESSDDSDDDSSSPASVEAPIISPAAPLATQAPSGVTTRKKPTQPVPFKPRSKVERAPVPGKSGWIRKQVQRQSGATAGQWDVYFYPPGQQVKLRSRPEVSSYCENELNEPYVAADYDWKPSQKPVDTVV